MSKNTLMANRQKQETATVKHHHVALLAAALILAVLVSWRPEARETGAPASGVIAADNQDSAPNEQIAKPELLQTSVEATVAVLPTQPAEPEFETHQVHSGDSLFVLLQRAGVSAQEIMQVIDLGELSAPLKKLRPGQFIELAQDEQGIVALRYALNSIDTLLINRTEESFAAEVHSKNTETRLEQTSGTITSSLFLAAQSAGLEHRLIVELTEIFAWDVDFNLDLRTGDQFTVVYEAIYHDDEKLQNNKIVSAEFINRNVSHRAVRYQAPDGTAGYYAPDGRSVRKAFLRSPVKFSRISSRFDPSRLHPVLKTSRPHRGVDYAAGRGTPIHSTGDGKVIWVGTKGGYGRTVIVRHGGRYSTLYAHMNSYAKIRTGQAVKQGQTIGYVGASGLATGPHLHYEFRLDGVHRNPLTVKFPAAEPVAEELLADFQQQTAPLFAELGQSGRVNLAAN